MTGISADELLISNFVDYVAGGCKIRKALTEAFGDVASDLGVDIQDIPEEQIEVLLQYLKGKAVDKVLAINLSEIVSCRLQEIEGKSLNGKFVARDCLDKAIKQTFEMLEIETVIPPEQYEVLVQDVEQRATWWRERILAGEIPVAPGVVAEVVSVDEYKDVIDKQAAEMKKLS